MKSLPLFYSILLLLPVTSVFAEETASSHTSVTTSANPQGVAVTTEKSNSNHKSADGTETSEHGESTTLDPKGTNNRLTAKTTHTRVDSKNGDFKDSNTVKHADGTYEENTVKKETKGHWLDKGKTSTTTRSAVVDPVGLGNKQEVEVTEKVVTNPDGSGSKTVTEKVGGEVLSETETKR